MNKAVCCSRAKKAAATCRATVAHALAIPPSWQDQEIAFAVTSASECEAAEVERPHAARKKCRLETSPHSV